nr:3'-5' exonuclease [uncultured Hyphomonas sp.]
MANARSGTGLYLAFNRKIAQDARQNFPDSVACMTTHSLAVQWVRKHYNFSTSKLFDSMGNRQLAELLKLEPRTSFGDFALTHIQQAHLFRETVRRFCLSGSDQITADHVPVTGLLKFLPELVTRPICEWVAERARELWQRMTTPEDPIPLGHDGYLKLWSLSNPQLAYDYVLLDEAQDTNPAVLSVLEQQDTQMVYVGDRHQQIYAWRGAVNAMKKIDTDQECYLTQSFRFGPEIAANASRVIRKLGEPHALRGNPDIRSSISERGYSDAILTRKNATAFTQTLRAIGNGRKPFIVGGTGELKLLIDDVQSLMQGRPGAHPDFFGFQDWSDVVSFSQTKEGADLWPFVSLVERLGPEALRNAINNSAPSLQAADVAISTIHKAKGLEWPSVRVASDFIKTLEGRLIINEDELRLFYVAITRARQRLLIEEQLLDEFAFGDFPNSSPAPSQSPPETSATPPPLPPTPTASSPPSVTEPSQPARGDGSASQPPGTRPKKRFWFKFGKST